MSDNNSRPPSAPAALLLLLTTFLPTALAVSPVCSTDVLFLAYDQGESNAFLRIQAQLDKRAVSYKIIAFGRAAEIYRHHPALIHIKGISDNPDLHFHREQNISIKAIRQASESIRAKIIYSGMASKAQAQLLNHYGKQDSYLIAFYDNFDPVESKKYVQPFLGELNRVDEFHLPSDQTATSFETLKQIKQAKTVVTGQPVLEAWDEIFIKTDPEALRKKLEINSDQSVILFAGGYDDDYPNSFRIFLKATKLMPGTLFLVTHHPKYSGELEQQLIGEEETSNVRLLHEHQASTPELSTIASAVVVHKSTVAQQALYKGKPVVYVADSSFSNFILKTQLANRAYTPEQLHNVLLRILSPEPPPSPLLNTSGIPANASRHITDRLMFFLNKRDEDQ